MLTHVHGAALVCRPQAEKVHVLMFFINMHARIYLPYTTFLLRAAYGWQQWLHLARGSNMTLSFIHKETFAEQLTYKNPWLYN